MNNKLLIILLIISCCVSFQIANERNCVKAQLSQLQHESEFHKAAALATGEKNQQLLKLNDRLNMKMITLSQRGVK